MHVVPIEEIKVGSKVNDWTLLSVPSVIKAKAIARCKCGIVKEQSFHNIIHGLSKRCRRCSSRESYRKTALYPEKVDRIYQIWQGMRKRVRNGEGVYGRIKVCPAWDDPETFRAWALENGYAAHLSIDRIDNDGDYCPENCRWTTAAVQRRNQDRNRLVTIFGETRVAMDWAKDSRCVVSWQSFYYRLKKGWNPEDALLKPAESPHDRRKLTETQKAEIRSLKGKMNQWKLAAKYGVSRSLVQMVHGGKI